MHAEKWSSIWCMFQIFHMPSNDICLTYEGFPKKLWQNFECSHIIRPKTSYTQFKKLGVQLTSSSLLYARSQHTNGLGVSKAELFPLQGRVVVVLMVTCMVGPGAMGRDLWLVVEKAAWYEKSKLWWSTSLCWASSFGLRLPRHRKQA